MKEKLTNNLSLKILSLFVAILVWLLAINIDNPIVKKTFIVTDVQLLNEAILMPTVKCVCEMTSRSRSV